MKIKDIKDLTLYERSALSVTISKSYFKTDEITGEVEYAPYQRHLSELMGFATMCVEDYDKTKINEKDIVKDKELASYYTEYSKQDIWQEMLNDARDMSEFKKQQLLKSQDEVSKLVSDLLMEQIETTRKQKEVLNNTIEINNSYSKEEIEKLAGVFADFNGNFNNVDFQKSLVTTLAQLAKNKPQDHKKPANSRKKKVVELPVAEKE